MNDNKDFEFQTVKNMIESYLDEVTTRSIFRRNPNNEELAYGITMRVAVIWPHNVPSEAEGDI